MVNQSESFPLTGLQDPRSVVQNSESLNDSWYFVKVHFKFEALVIGEGDYNHFDNIRVIASCTEAPQWETYGGRSSQ